MTLHILKKDVRRLWPAIAVSLTALGGLAWHDRWRTDAIAGQNEDMLTALTQVLWVLLLGLAVGQDPIAGDRQFWLTRPYSRRALLGAKLLFAVLFVHVPSLLADCVVLAGRGFAPSDFLGHLLGKQVMLLCSLTLPALALATLVRSFTHLVLVLVGITVVLLLVNGAWLGHGSYISWAPIRRVRGELAALVSAVIAAVILGLQYYGRRVAWSRGIGLVGGAGAALLFSWLLPHTALAIRTATDPAPASLAIRLDASGRSYPHYGGYRDVAVALPVVIEGFAPGETARLDSVRSETLAGNGRRFSDAMPIGGRQRVGPQYSVYVHKEPAIDGQWWMHLSFERSTFAALEGSPVTLRGEIGATLIRPGAPAWMAVGETRIVAGLGRCTTAVTSDRFAERLRLMCEAPRIEAPNIPARAWSPESGREWKMHVAVRSSASLSPLDRVQNTWEIMPEPLPPHDRSRIPASAVPTARIEVIPQEVLGYAAIRYEFRNLDLRRYRPASASSGAAR